MVTQLSEELILVKVPIFVAISLLNKLQNIIVADVDIKILVEYVLYIVESHETSLFSVEQSEQIKGLLFSALSEEPFLSDHFDNIA